MDVESYALPGVNGDILIYVAVPLCIIISSQNPLYQTLIYSIFPLSPILLFLLRTLGMGGDNTNTSKKNFNNLPLVSIYNYYNMYYRVEVISKIKIDFIVFAIATCSTGCLLQVPVIFGGQKIRKSSKSRSRKSQALEKPGTFFSDCTLYVSTWVCLILSSVKFEAEGSELITSQAQTRYGEW